MVIDQLAEAVVENIRHGIVHGDMWEGSILVSGRRRPKVKIMDWAQARPITTRTVAHVDPTVDYDYVRRWTIPDMVPSAWDPHRHW